ERDIVVGAPIYKQEMEGDFINTVLPLRNRLDHHMTFKELLLEVRQTLTRAAENQGYPMEVLLEELNLENTEKEFPLFDVVVLVENIHKKSDIRHTHPNIMFSFLRSDGLLTGEVEFNRLRYEKETVKRLARHLQNLLHGVLLDVDMPLGDIDILSDSERKQLLYDFNDTKYRYPSDKTIHELFEEQAERTPDHIAVVGKGHGCMDAWMHGNISITYGELNQKADQLAHYLRQKGVTENHLVGIMVEKSLEMIIGILGILKAGGAYIPLNSKAPAARSKYILDDCHVSILLTIRSLSKEITFEREIVYLDDYPESKTYSHFRGGGVSADTSSFLANQSTGGSSGFAYVIFTSGSTGKPKGVSITHSNLSPLLHWGYHHLGLSTGDRTIQNLAYYFDWSVWEIFITLTAGVILYMVPEEIVLNPGECIDFMTKNDITVLHMTPSQFLYLVNAAKPLETLRYLFLGAEKLTHDLLQRAFVVVSNNCRVFNMYGPTEATIISSVLEIDRDDLDEYIELNGVPIGKPVGNTGLLVLDRYLNLCPLGVIGELYIAGVGLAAGYLNNPELTVEKFIVNPYTSQPSPLTTQQSPITTNRLYRMYRTGDLSRWLPDGNIEFLGRIDFQVKIRGFRVELGEVEAQLMDHEGIREAVVLVKEDAKREKYLCAYTVACGTFEKAPSTRELKEYLVNKLPDYMIPSYFIQVERIPLTPNGKVDRKALPAPEIKAGADYTAPRNEIEEKLVEIWSEVLGVEHLKIGIDDNFFELGGHSLKGTVLLFRIHKMYHVQVLLAELFKRPTVRELAEYILSSNERIYEAIEPVPKQEYYPQSPAQRRLFFLDQFENIGISYNLPAVFKIVGQVDMDKMENTFRKLIQRHESLRTSFHMIDGQPVQKIHEEVEFEIESPFEIEAFVLPFDLSKAPLMRVGIVPLPREEWLLVVDMHHIISDGTSTGIFIREFMSLYAGEELPPLNIQYKDYAVWQNSEKKRDLLKKQEDYWLEQFTGEIPVLDVSIDCPRPSVQSFAGRTLLFELGKEETAALNRMARDQGATLYIFLLAVYTVLFSKLSGQEDIIIGTSTAGRRHADLEPIMGMFINTMGIRNFPRGKRTFKEFLQEVKERTLLAFENQDYQFEDLVERIEVNRDASRNPLFDVVFVLQNIEITEVEIPGLKLSPYEFENKTAKFDLTLWGFEREDRLSFSLEYCTKLFKETTIERFIKYFVKIISVVIESPGEKIADIDIISEEEKQQLLYDFNNTKANFPSDKTLHELFAEQVERNLYNIATASGRCALTYRELNQRSNQLAHLLRAKGVTADTIVAIIMDPSLEMISTILAVLKAGGTYLPIDPAYPPDRVAFILKDCNAPLLVTRNWMVEKHSFISLQGLQTKAAGMHFTGIRPPVSDFNDLPAPDRSLVDYERYNCYIGQAMVKNCISLQATRGCPYNCAYCHKIWQKKHVVRSARHIYNEVRLYYDMGVRRFVFIDDIFNLNRENTREFFQLIIENQLDVHFFFPNGLRGDLLSEADIDLMVRAGTVNVALALETASPRLQKMIGKNLDLEKLKRNIEYFCQKYPHVILELFTMHGFPTETEEEALMTLDFIKSIKWLHFPYVHILKIYPNTDMAKIAIENGIREKDILKSAHLAYHELPETLPFERKFTLQYQADFLNEYFLSKERFLQVLPYQMNVLTEDEIVQKYDSYLPVEIHRFSDLLRFVGIRKDELEETDCLDEASVSIPHFNKKLAAHFAQLQPEAGALRVLLLDLSQFFSAESRMLYDVVEPPLGLMYLLTYLSRRQGNNVKGKIAKSRIDFDNYSQLKSLLTEFKPDVIGIRTLSFYKDFFHKTVAMIRHWGIDVPIIAGGPYATSESDTIVRDRNVDLVVLGEGEITFCEVIERIIENNGRLPSQDILEKIPGLVYVPTKGVSPKAFAREILFLDEMDQSLAGESEENLEQTNRPEETAYIIYTSGTTGRPKGVMIEHCNVVRLMFNDKFQFDFSDKDIWSLFHSYCFDFSVWEMYGALLYGGKLVVVPRIAARDTERFLELLKEEGVTVLNQTPSAFYPLVAEELRHERSNLDLRYVIFGGEALNPVKLKEWKARYPGVRLINMFGITETTVHVTYKEITGKEIDAGISNIGKPIPTLSTYVLDKYQKLVPIGVAGELCVGGAGVARGYLNRPELTAGKFVLAHSSWLIADRREKRVSSSGELPLSYELSAMSYFYKSGDLARLLPDGDIEYLGRIDTQVQVRGHRVEPGEIENQLLSHHDIKDAVVIERKDKGGDSCLCAYIVGVDLGASGAEREEPACCGLDVSELRHYLSQTLPDYMIPSFFVSIESIPLTPNGKVDRKALPAPEIQTGEGYVAPRNELENKLVEIWSEVLALDKDRIGIDANFFELGGHSLKVTVMIAKVHEELGVKVPLTEVFITPFIRGLAQYIHTADREQYAPLEPVGEGEYYDASYAQHRLWIICQFEDESTAYNIPGAFIIEGELNIDAWEWALQQLVNRHDGFRTAFISINGGPKQTILKHLEFKPVHVDLRELVPGEKEEEAKNLFTEVANKPFNLEQAPLFRVTLARLEDERYLLIFNMHHIVSDAWSLGTLVRDFSALYNGFSSWENKEGPLLPLRFQYKDYAAWHNRLVESDTFSQAERFWLEKFKDKPNGMELPLDHSRKARQTFNGGTVNFMIDRGTALKLKARCLQVDATLFMGILAVLHVLLYKYTGQADIIIGLPEVGRRHPELYDIVGFFVNTLVYRHTVEPGEAFAALLEKVKQAAVDCYQHQDYPFNMLVEKLELDRDISQSPLFNVMLSHNNTDVQGGANEWRMEGVTVRPYAETDEFNMSVFDLIFFTRELGEVDHVDGFIMYNSDLFDRSTIERMARNLQTLVKHIVNNSSQPVHALSCISPDEYETIIYKFNNNDYDYPKKTVQELFEEQVLKSADDTAVVYNEREISYNDLNRQANQLAHYLREECGIRPNHIAAIAIDRSLELIIAILGILKSGGGYLSIDPNYPEDRVLHMLIDSRCRVLIQDKARPELFGNYDGRILHILDDWQTIARQLAENPETVNSMGDTIYVIYTSGSTGTPNGAMLSQDLLANLIRWQREKTTINDSLRCLQFTTTSFCVSFQEIMMTLTSGGQLYLIGEVERQDIDYLMDFLSRNEIENLYLPFSYLNFLFNESNRFGPSFEHSLKHIITAGEQLKITSGLKTFLEQNPRVQLHNHYGSSEMHVVTSYTLDTGTASVMPVPPAGKPIANTKIYILDEYRHPVPIGVWGELCIAGCSEVPGYINNKTLTDKKLLKHPLLPPGDNKRLYISGDIGRWLPDGNIELKGRKDSQVKIRGFRVELCEIESKILAIDRVKDCVVEVKTDKHGQKFLVAYVVKENIDVSEIKRIINAYLPQHMVPQFMVLDSLPLMPNGKVDRERLPDPEARQESVRQVDTRQISRLLEEGQFKTIPWQGDGIFLDKDALENFLAHLAYIVEDEFLGERLPLAGVDIEMLPGDRVFARPPSKKEPVLTVPRRQITDFDSLSIPDRSLVDYEKYGKRIGLAMVKHTISIQATRGCPYNCLYCHKIWPKRHVVRSAAHIFKELQLYYNMGFRRFVFVDDIFNLDVKNSKEFFRMIIDNGLDVQLFFPNGLRTDLLTREYIDLMVKAGTVSLGLALETASPRLQKLIKKNMNLDKLRENVEYLCEKYPRVILELFLMHGFPTETREEARMTLDFLKRLKWVDFPYYHLLKIYPHTDMAEMAVQNGIPEQAILNSANLAFHELPETLPFEKSFTLGCQADFLNNYFLLKERLLAKLPYQMKVLTDDEIVQKYNSYLPVSITTIDDLLDVVEIKREELAGEFLDDRTFAVTGLQGKMKEHFPASMEDENGLRVLLLDTSQFFTRERDILYDGVEPPLGLMYLLTYLQQEFGSSVTGKIAKSRIDFDNFAELRILLEEFQPDMIGIRTLTYYKNLFHQTVSWIRQWGFTGPLIAGGPYATSDYETVLQDKNIDLVVMSEGEITFAQLIGKMIENGGQFPLEEELKTIDGIAFVPGEKRPFPGTGQEVEYPAASCILPRTQGQVLEALVQGGPLSQLPSFGDGSIGLVEFYKKQESEPGEASLFIRLRVDGSLLEGQKMAASQLPRDETEEKLAEIWANVLEIEKQSIGIEDNFFELGGHSLKATTMVSQIHKELNVKVPLVEMFKSPTIRGLADYIRGMAREQFTAVEALENKEYYPLSSAQQRMYIRQQLKPEDTGYNNPTILLLEGELNKKKLEETFMYLIRRHESLRTSFETVDETPVQVIHNKVDFEIEFYDAAAKNAKEREEIIIRNFVHPFDLTKAPLIRVGLIEVKEKKHIVMFDMHHIITDGVSLRIFAEEFMALYGGEELPELRLQYRDFTQWQNRLLASGEMEKQEAYWLKRFAGDIPVLEIPTDFPRPSLLGGEGGNVSFEIDSQLTAAIKQVGAETDATVFMVLLSVCNILLGKYSGQEDITIGSSIAGRRHADLENIIGMFVNMLAVRNRPAKDKIFLDFLTEVRENAFDAYSNQDVQFDELVRKLELQGNPGRNPLFDVVFKLQNMDIPEIIIPGLVLKPYGEYNEPGARFDLVIGATESGERIIMDFNYSSDLFKRSTIEDMAKHFLEVLEQILENPRGRLKDIDISMKLRAAKSRVQKEEAVFGF
nr:amino acid adenylation domain-containing protein [Candidatus Aminicenantes bacterium]NIM81428.1 amino acid adenylation domain-containing protein [Candidatus Aminicenantes bacterium]NIN20828.1 amino acid adenylation domain-containing protein [Candidatus Aminicenantes bacterium]NIN44614.1 amino acid adenylation domain-containing protein [Candidatus Aminicenantes bacterium]NIN87430.1 amino acid adenylation domain-containing protein [Candidatus Aminicenantes bacterium]